MTRWLVRMPAVTLCMLLTLPAARAQPAPAPATLNKAARSAVVHATARALRNGYIFPDVGEKAGRRLEDALESGAYDSISTPAGFATQLTADLASVAHDKHLSVMVSGSVPPIPGWPPPRSEAGVVRSDLLSGNIGYIEIVGLPGVGAFSAALERALAPLAKTKALIIDDRRNLGGSPQAEAYLAGYLLPKGGPQMVMDRVVFRVFGTQTFDTIDFSTAPTPVSFAGKPVYVLVSRDTLSGGEALAYGLQVRHMARIVGEITGGGANPGGIVPLAAGLDMFLPSGRADNPVTHTNWEGVGVRPDVQVPRVQALQVALQLLGQKPAGADIDALSQVRLFTPRTTRQPGSEPAVRRLIAEHQSGHVDLSLLSGDLAKGTEDMQRLHDLLAPLGAVQSVSFEEIGDGGDDVYNVKLAKGSIRFLIMLGLDGKTVVDEDAEVLPDGPLPNK